MTKPRGIAWLEQQTGQALDRPASSAGASQDRHFSVRLSADLADGLAALAAEDGVTMSHYLRRLVADAVTRRGELAVLDDAALADRLAADAAEVRRRLAS
jgi:hypothetical protein